MTPKQIKADILKLFEQEKELGYSDIISRLDVDLRVAVQICDELANEGKIEAIEC